MANYLLKLFGAKRDPGSARTVVGELDIAAQDDLSAIRRLRDSILIALSDCDCAELYGPDGKMVWEHPGDLDG